jgi:hypothetical protein
MGEIHLPEDDQEYLATKQLRYELRMEPTGNGERHAIWFPEFQFDGKLYRLVNSALELVSVCELLILIPTGYSTTKLDSFYTFPHLKRADGSDPDRATGSEPLFDRPRQFWSRHLGEGEWRPGIDGLETYIQYVRRELRAA